MTADGRVDAMYGEVYHRLPPGTPYFSTQPLPNSAIAMHRPAGQAAPAALAAAGMTIEELFVGVVYAEGDRRVTTYRADGARLEAPLIDAGVEYELSDAVKAVSAAYPATGRPPPSAVLESFRLGRVIGPDVLVPADVPHWCRAQCGGGPAWVNLNAPDVRKFSDADFPPWRGWRVIDDSPDRDSRCDSALIRRWLDADGNGTVLHAEAEARRHDRGVAARLARTICKFPSEWDAADFDKRWGWVKAASAELDQPMSDDTFERMRAHVTAMAFWNEKATGVPVMHWRFEPREFIRQFRKCGWLSRREMLQLPPDNAIRGKEWERVNLQPDSTTSLVSTQLVPLNKMLRKYGITSPLRLTTFLGNSLQETRWLEVVAEVGGNSIWYAPWYGRGFLQLTHPDNYFDYWAWRGRITAPTLRAGLIKASADSHANQNNAAMRDINFPSLTPEMIRWREEVQAIPTRPDTVPLIDPTDSAGFYWTKAGMAKYADEAHSLERVEAATVKGLKTYYRSKAFWRASASVNSPGVIANKNYSGLNGFDSRCSAYGTLLAGLMEIRFPNAAGDMNLEFPEGYQPRR